MYCRFTAPESLGGAPEMANVSERGPLGVDGRRRVGQLGGAVHGHHGGHGGVDPALGILPLLASRAPRASSRGTPLPMWVGQLAVLPDAEFWRQQRALNEPR
jgi:hypothetical protein